MKFIEWVRASLEGHDGKSSSRKLTVLIVVGLYAICSIYFYIKVIDPHTLLLLLVLHAVFACVLLGLVTADQIIRFKHKNDDK